MPRRKSRMSRDYSLSAPEQRPGESDLQYFKRLAKQADQRLVRIERYAKEKNFQGMINYAYASAMYDIRNLTSNPDANRFNTVPTKTKDGSINVRNLRAKINAVKRFLEAPTSTKQGLTKVYKNRANTVNRKYGTNFTWQDLAAYYSKNSNRAFDSEYGSDTMLIVLDGLKELKTMDPEDIKKAAAGDIKICEDEVANEIAENLLQQGLTFDDLVPSGKF